MIFNTSLLSIDDPEDRHCYDRDSWTLDIQAECTDVTKPCLLSARH